MRPWRRSGGLPRRCVAAMRRADSVFVVRRSLGRWGSGGRACSVSAATPAGPGGDIASQPAAIGRRLRGGLQPAALRRRLRAGSRALGVRVARELPALAAGLAAAIPVIVSTVNAARAGWEPDGDDGIILTRAFDVFTSHTPLVGQYSEAGNVTGQIVHSPGPMLYWLLAIPVRIGGADSAAIAIGVVNTLCIIGCVVLARRRGGPVLMFAVSVGIALMCQSLAGEVFHDVWNPSAAMFPFLLLIFLCWSVACGELRLLPAVAIVASFVTQTHLTYLAPTLVLITVAIAGLIATRLLARRAGGAPVRRAAVGLWVSLAALALLVCWSAPLLDELERSPGNLSLIVTTVHDRGATLGPRVGVNAVVRAVGLTPWFLYVPKSEWARKLSVRATSGDTQTATALLLLAALALIAIAGALRRRVDLCAAALIGFGMCLGLGADAANTPAAPLLAGTLGYTMWWGSQLGLWIWLIVLWALYLAAKAGLPLLLRGLVARTGKSLRRPGPGQARALGVALTLAGLLATAGVGEAVASIERPDSHVRAYRPTSAIGRALDAAIPAGQTIDYRLGSLDLATQPIEPAVRFLLVKHGDRPLAEGSLPRLGPYYELYHRRYSWIVFLGDGKVRPAGHLRLVAREHFHDQWGPQTLSAWVGRAAANGRRRDGRS